MKSSLFRSVLVATVATSIITGGAAFGDVRDVQIAKIDTSIGVVTLRNLSGDDQPLDLYRICTADDNESFRYSGADGFAGRTIEAGTDFRIHWNDDAPKSDPDAINVGDLGGFIAGPLDNGPFGLCVYWRTPFGTAANMGDYVQWTDDLDNPANLTADARASTAVTGGLWTVEDAWVVTNPDTTMITLNDESGEELHGPDDYDVDGTDPCPEDIDDSGSVGFADLLRVLSAWGSCGECPEDVNDDGEVNFDDLLRVLSAWGPC